VEMVMLLMLGERRICILAARLLPPLLLLLMAPPPHRIRRASGAAAGSSEGACRRGAAGRIRHWREGTPSTNPATDPQCVVIDCPPLVLALAQPGSRNLGRIAPRGGGRRGVSRVREEE
jgi:hypothetical protein